MLTADFFFFFFLGFLEFNNFLKASLLCWGDKFSNAKLAIESFLKQAIESFLKHGTSS